MMYENPLGGERAAAEPVSLRPASLQVTALTARAESAPEPPLWVITLLIRKRLVSPLSIHGACPAPMSHPTSLEWEPNSYIRDVEFFDVRKTYAGERAPWPLILTSPP